MPKDRVPIFDVDSHTYTDPLDDFKYTSVTRWVEKFKEPFDEDNVARRIAARECISVDIILEEWEKKREDSKVFGTSVHKLLETYFTTKKISDKKLQPILKNFKELNVQFNETTFFEKLVYNRKMGIAGMSDIITHNEDGCTFDVYDFKTNKKFRFSSDFNDYLLSPINNYPDCEYFSYSFQLSMYAYLYKQMSGLEPKRLKIFWYNRANPENYNAVEGEWKIINVPYLEEDLIRCLKHEKQKIMA